jgi:hypothetical protein
METWRHASLFVGFGCLTVAWLLVAAGMGRAADAP